MERLRSDTLAETDPSHDIDVERSMGRNALQVLTVEKEPVVQETSFDTHESIRRPDGLAYAQDQEIYKPYAGEAAAIVMKAFIGDFSALDRIPDKKIREALRDRILAGNNEIDKMISVACIGLAPHLN